MLKKLYNIKEKVLIETEWTSNKYVRALMETMIFRVNRKYKQEKADIGKAYDEIIKSETKVVMIHEFFFAFFYLLVIFVKIIIIIMGRNNKNNYISNPYYKHYSYTIRT